MPDPDHIRQSRLNAGLVVAATESGFHINGPPTFIEGKGAWVVPITLEIGRSSKDIPASTRWMMLVDIGYPYGRVEFYPSATGGLTATFQHQDPNLALGDLWRTGKLCLDNPYRLRLIASRGNDPVGDADARIAWYARRALEWLDRAVRGDLVHDTDPFEIPRCVPTRERVQFFHDESPASFGAWVGRERSWGRIVWHL